MVGEAAIMILRGYFDESYDKNAFTLCCSLSDATGWGDIERAWDFYGWSREERDELALKLMGTLRRGRAWVNTVSWSLPLPEFVQRFNIVGNPLPSCYRESLKFIMLEMAAQISDAKRKLRQVKPLKYVLFHERCSYDTVYLEAFNQMMNDPTFNGKELFSTIAPLGWEDSIALQPADMIAYEVFKDALRRFIMKARRPSLEYLLQSVTFGGRQNR